MGQEEDDKAIERVVDLMIARQPHAGFVAPILEANIREIISHTPSTGGYGTANWNAAVRAFGEQLIAIAKREEAKSRRSK
jgi:hypothetical protein